MRLTNLGNSTTLIKSIDSIISKASTASKTMAGSKQIIDQLTLATASHNIEVVKLALSQTGLSKAQIEAILLSKGLTGAELDTAVSTAVLSSSQAKATISTTTLATATKGLTTALMSNPLFIAGAVLVGIYAAVKATEALTVSFEEQQEVVDALSTNISTLQEEYDTLKAKDNRTDQENEYLGYLQRELDVQKELYKIEYNRLALKDLEGKGDPFSNGNLKDLNPQGAGTVNSVYTTDTSTAGYAYKIGEELKQIEEARKKITEAPNQNTVEYWSKIENKNIQSLKDQRENLLNEYKSSSDSYNLIKKYMDNGAFDSDPENKTKYTNLMKDYENDMKNIQSLIDKVELNIGISPTFDEAKDKIEELKKETEEPITIQMAISDIESLSDGLEKINSILDDVKDKGTFDFGSLIDEGFVATFGTYETEYQNFVNTIANSPNDIKACQQAFDDLTTAYIYGQDALKNVTDETYDATVAMLKQKGVANANEVATMALVKSKIDAFLAGKDLKNITDDEITAFLHENGVIDVTIGMIDALQLAKLTANGTTLDFQKDITNIVEYTEKLGGSIVALKMLQEAQRIQSTETGANSYAWSGMSDVASAAKGEVQSALNQAMSVKVDYKGYTPPKTTKTKEAKEDYKAEIDKYKELSDAVEAVRDSIEKLKLEYDNSDSLEEQIKIKEQLITLYEDEKKALDALNTARDVEIAQNAEKLRKAGFQVEYDAISDSLQIKNREHLNDLSQKTIKDYEDLIKKTDELNDANKDSAKQWNELTYTISDTVDEISKLKSDQYEDYISDAEHLIELLDKRSDSLGDSIPVIQDMMDATVSEWERLIQEGYEKNKSTIQQLQSAWMDYYDKRIQAEIDILNLQKDSKDATRNAVINLLDDQIKGIDDQIEALQKLNDERKEALDLQKAQAVLDAAREQKTKRVLRRGLGFVPEADEDAIIEAQENLADIQYNNRISALEKEKEAIEEYKELWSSIPDEYEKAQNELIAEQELGAHWENKITDLRLSTYRSFKDDYFDLQDDIESKTEELNKHLNEEYINMVKIFEQMSTLMGKTPSGGNSIESMMSESDKAAIKAAQSAYNTAKAQGNTTAMESAHAMAESIRDKYRDGVVADTPNVASTGTPITNASNATPYTKQPYELVSSTKTGGSSSGGNSSLRTEYERQLSLAEKYGGSDAYKERLKTNIAIEKYGSGHNIDTYSNGIITNSKVINATNKEELNMSADDIQKKYEASVKNNTSSLNKVDSELKGNTNATEYAGDAMYDASDSVSDAAKSVVDSNKSNSDAITNALKNLSNVGNSSSKGGESSGSKSSGESAEYKQWKSAYDTAKSQGNKVAMATAKKGMDSSKKKAKGGINLPADVYNVNEEGAELIIQPKPQEGNWVSVTNGTSILPADISKNLMNFGSDPTAYLRQMSANQIAGVTRIQNNTTPIVNNYHIEANLPNVKNEYDFMENLPNLARQYAARR